MAKAPWRGKGLFYLGLQLIIQGSQAEVQSRSLKIGTEVEWSLHINEENALEAFPQVNK